MIRLARAADAAALYDVCVRTGDSGGDATGMYLYPDLLGDVFVGPYLALEPELSFVVDDGAGAEGYTLGALDSTVFAERCEAEWWPAIRRKYADLPVPDTALDQWVLRRIENPPPVREFAVEFPSHLHIDLLPRWQSGGWGRRLIETMLARLRALGSPGVHLEVSPRNERAIGFYRHLGFHDVGTDPDTRWMAKPL